MTGDESSEGGVVCTCCGVTIANTLAGNAWFGEVPYPGDAGTGMCWKCGGDPEAASSRERLGFAVTTFVDARIPFVAERLSKDNRQRFFAMPYEDQAKFILLLVERGRIT